MTYLLKVDLDFANEQTNNARQQVTRILAAAYAPSDGTDVLGPEVSRIMNEVLTGTDIDVGGNVVHIVRAFTVACMALIDGHERVPADALDVIDVRFEELKRPE